LGLNPKRERLNIDRFVPAPAQGIIAVVTGSSGDAHNIMKRITHLKTHLEMDCERNLMRSLELGCSSPAGIYCYLDGNGKIIVRVSLYSRTGNEYMELNERISEPSEALELGKKIRETIPESFGYYR
jgi:hydroxymethylbilane synthase